MALSDYYKFNFGVSTSDMQFYTMSTSYGYAGVSLDEPKQRGRRKTFDWVYAARLIRESGCSTAMAGLDGDWAATADVIYSQGAPLENALTYLSSDWATLTILIAGKRSPCWKWEEDNPTFLEATAVWPKEAKAVLYELDPEEPTYTEILISRAKDSDE
jgi:hypothetical protein